MLVWRDIGEQIIKSAQSSTKNVVIIAPFIKQATLGRILNVLPLDVPVTCVTRWRVEELKCRVSDLEVYVELMKRRDSKLFLVNDLHAKYYRFDNTIIIGSCNITNAALGYHSNSNLELSYFLHAEESTRSFEEFVLKDGIAVSSQLYESMKIILEKMPEFINGFSDSLKSLVGNKDQNQYSLIEKSKDVKNWLDWLPSCRSPEFLYDVYMGNESMLSQSALIDAKRDLQQLFPPPGLTRTQFNGFISGTIMMSPLIEKLAKFATTPRRFGEMKNKVRELLPNSSPENDWQTLMRWLLYFLPERFTFHVANFSEIFTAKW